MRATTNGRGREGRQHCTPRSRGGTKAAGCRGATTSCMDYGKARKDVHNRAACITELHCTGCQGQAGRITEEEDGAIIESHDGLKIDTNHGLIN